VAEIASNHRYGMPCRFSSENFAHLGNISVVARIPTPQVTCPHDIVMLADPLLPGPPVLVYPSTAITSVSSPPSRMPRLAHSSKCFLVLMVPPTRFSVRTDQYCWKVRVPSMEGLLVRVLVKISKVPSSFSEMVKFP